MPQTSYQIINSLEEVEFIAGTNFTFTFLVYDANGSPLDLSSGTVLWTLCPYGQPDYPVLSITGVVDNIITNKFTVNLETDDTKDLYGKFIQQPVVLDFADQEFRPAQGVVTISARINNI